MHRVKRDRRMSLSSSLAQLRPRSRSTTSSRSNSPENSPRSYTSELRTARLNAQVEALEEFVQQHKDELGPLFSDLTAKVQAVRATLASSFSATPGAKGPQLVKVNASEERSRQMEKLTLFLEGLDGPQFKGRIAQEREDASRANHKGAALGLRMPRFAGKAAQEHESEMLRVVDELQAAASDAAVMEAAATLYSILRSGGSADDVFLKNNGQRVITAVLFMEGLADETMACVLGLFQHLMLAPLFSVSDALNAHPLLLHQLYFIFMQREEIVIRQLILSILANLAQRVPQLVYTAIVGSMDEWSAQREEREHFLTAIIRRLPDFPDMGMVADVLLLVNLALDSAKRSNALPNFLERFGGEYHEMMKHFGGLANALSHPAARTQLRRYQTWHARQWPDHSVERFRHEQHWQHVQCIWRLRFPARDCPVTPQTTGYAEDEEVAALWLEAGFRRDPSSYFKHEIEACVLAAFFREYAAECNTLLDDLRKRRTAMARMSAVGGNVSIKGDFDFAGVAVSVIWRTYLALHDLAASEIPPLTMLWTQEGQFALLLGSLHSIRLAYKNFKTLDPSQSHKVADEAVRNYIALLQSNPSTEEELCTLSKFFAERSSAVDRNRTLRGQVAAAVAPPAFVSNPWETSYPNVYRKTLEEMEVGAGGVPHLITQLGDAIFSWGGDTTVGIFRLQAAPADLARVEAQLEAGNVVLGQKGDPNVPANILKRVLGALDPPLISNYHECIRAIKEDRFDALHFALQKLPPLRKKTLAFVVNLWKYFVEPEVVKKTKMTAANIAMVFAPTVLVDPDRKANPSFGQTFLERDLLHYLICVAKPLTP